MFRSTRLESRRMGLLAFLVCLPFWSTGCGSGSADAQTLTAAQSAPSVQQARRSDARSGEGSPPPNVLYVRSASGSAIANHPLHFGRPFRQGEIAACPTVLVDGVPAANAQADVKTRHPDGSVRFAVISAVLPTVPSGDGVAVTFANDPDCKPSPALSAAEMLDARFDFDARIALNGGAAGTASARDMLSRGHFKLWTSGRTVTTALIADHEGKTFDIGVDAYKSLRPVFEVQFWPAVSKARVRVILEATDTEKIQNQDYDVTVATGAASPAPVLSATGVKHNFMSRWTRVFWIGGEPSPVDIDYGLAYLASTRALPNYDPSIKLSETAKSAMLAAWAAAPKGLYGKGLWTPDMTVAGGRADLGPHPRWMAGWLYEGSAALKDVALGQADLAASWPMHLREGNPTKFTDRGRTLPAAGLPVSGYARPTLAYMALDFNYTRAEDRVRPVGSRSGNGWSPDNAHQPQPFFIPYLLTGEHFYNEQLLFWAGFSMLDNSWGGYGGACYSRSATPEYLGLGGQLRGMAWGLRMVSEAAWAAPDANAGSQRWLRDAVEDSITRFEGSRGVVRGNNTQRTDWQWANGFGDCTAGVVANGNPLRFWDRGNVSTSNPSVARTGPPWQFSFMMYSLNRAYELGMPADALREWFAPFFVGAVANGGITPYHLGEYVMPFFDGETGTFYQTWDSINLEYATYSLNKSWPPASAPGSNSVNSLDQGYGTAALVALAATAGLPGSDAAWESFAAPHYAAWGWSNDPKWAILPRTAKTVTAAIPGPAPDAGTTPDVQQSPQAPQAEAPAQPPATTEPPVVTAPSETTGAATEPAPGSSNTAGGSLPAWLATTQVFEWRDVPDSRIVDAEQWNNYKGAAGNSGKGGLFAYSGGTVKPEGSEFFIAGGGHTNYAGNEVFSITLGSDAPKWIRRNDPSNPTPMDVTHYPDGRPSSRHTYRNLIYSTALKRLIFFGGAPWGYNPKYHNVADTFDPAKNDYDPPGLVATAPRTIGGPVGTGVSAAGDFYIHHDKDDHLYKWEQSTNTWHDLGKKGGIQYETPYTVDTKRNRLFRIPWGSQPARIYDLNKNGDYTNITITGPAAATINTGAGLVYDPVNDVYWLMKRNDATLYRIDAETFSATAQTVTGAVPPAVYKDARHNLYGRFNYVPELRGLVLLQDETSSVKFVRTAP